jgi:hypothetical protein
MQNLLNSLRQKPDFLEKRRFYSPGVASPSGDIKKRQDSRVFSNTNL